MTNLKTVTESASDLGNEAKDSIEELGRTTVRKLDETRGETAAALHSAASSVRATGRRGSAAIDELSNGAADRLDATATYVEDHDLRSAFNSIQRYGRHHLAGSIVTAVALGFIAGSAISRATHSCCKDV